MRYTKYTFFLLLTSLCVLLLWSLFSSRRAKFHHPRDIGPTISTITYGEFIEIIPQTGIYDTIKSKAHLTIPIDELYFDRMKPGLIAETSFGNQDYTLIVTRIDSVVQAGRFMIEAKFQDTLPKIRQNSFVRIRLMLSDPHPAVMVPVGGFYKDTGGKWILVLQNDGTVVKRSIKLGKKNTEHFEVLDGLKVGERVITSWYEDFLGDDGEVDFDAVKDEIEKFEGSSRRDAFGMSS